MTSNPSHNEHGPVGLTRPDQSQISPLTPQQQQALTNRRRFLQVTVGGSLAAIGAAFAFPIFALKAITQYSDAVADGDLIGDPGSSTPLDLASFAVNTGTYSGVIGKSTQVNENLLEIVRVGESGTAEDFRAYNRICTHLGCPVTPTLNEAKHIWCGCHGSNFSIEDGSVVVGPAARPLPSIPVAFDDQGRLIIAGKYNNDLG